MHRIYLRFLLLVLPAFGQPLAPAAQTAITEFKFDEAKPFSEGLAAVKVSNLWGFIDSTGAWLTEPKWEDVRSFSEGLAAVQTEGKWGYIDRSGEIKVPPRFARASRHSDGLALVNMGDLKTAINIQGRTFVSQGRAGYVNIRGEYYIMPKFISAGDFSHGLAVIAKRQDDGEALFGFIDQDETYVVFPDSYIYAGQFYAGRAQVAREPEKYGFINTKGEVVIPLEYFGVSDFSEEGYASVVKNGKYGVIDTNGNYLLRPQFDRADLYRDGRLAVMKDGKWGYVDSTGAFVIPPRFAPVSDALTAMPFSEGLALTRMDGKWGYIDRSGAIAIPYVYEQGQNFSEGFAAVRKGAKWGFIRKPESAP